jgi:hypothetical protein
MRLNFLGETDPVYSSSISSERTINFIPEVHKDGSKTRVTLVGTPGTYLYETIGNSPVRGMHPFNNLVYIVAGNSLYSRDSSGTLSASLGTLSTSTGYVSMRDNGLTVSGVGGNQLAIADGADTYIYNVNTGVFAAQTKPASMIAYIDGYFVIVVPNSMSYQVSNLFDGTTWNALATSPVSATSDLLKAVENLHQQLWLVKQTSTEVWYNAGIATSVGSPFLRIHGAVIDYGTNAPWTVTRGDNSMFFLAWQRSGDSSELVGVVRVDGYTPKVISPPSLNYRMHQMSTTTDAFGYCYSENGHTFYVITFPAGNATYAYDTTTGLWHERSAYKEPYAIGRHVGNCYAFFDNKHLIGDYQSGNIYEMKSTYYTDNGDPIVSVRQAPFIFDMDSFDNVFIQRLIIDIESGIGDLGELTQTGLDPQASLSWSDDGGKTFSGEYQASMGKIGEYGKVLYWNQLGYTKKGKVFKVTVSDAIKKVLIGAYAEASQ